MNTRTSRILAVLVATGLVYQLAVAAPPASSSKRVAPPKFPASVSEVFFPDARERLVGSRPEFSAAAKVAGGPAMAPGQGDAEAASGESFAWSRLISATALEDEIKAQKLLVDQSVTTPGAFKGGGYRDARIQFSTLAAMFHIAGQFDTDVRWKSDAPALRELYARVGFNCKVGTDQTYNESVLRKQDLGDLVRGDRVQAAEGGEVDVTWDVVCNRPPLMSRMEQAFDKKINPFLANKSEFSAHAEEILHEAQVLAAISEAIQHEGFEFWDDEDYLEYARRMRDAALEIVNGVKQNNYEQARAAAGEVSKSCTECHESYRS